MTSLLDSLTDATARARQAGVSRVDLCVAYSIQAAMLAQLDGQNRATFLVAMGIAYDKAASGRQYLAPAPEGKQ